MSKSLFNTGGCSFTAYIALHFASRNSYSIGALVIGGIKTNFGLAIFICTNTRASLIDRMSGHTYNGF
ncbi:hypothetical protein [Mucilaginibacter sp. CSA2-8R]|uniref:hypothetical protein n=1 Tax=Mucilaginibacter sp. CSA2-8R TaxID=3141542 RepID=UPI00315D9884